MVSFWVFDWPGNNGKRKKLGREIIEKGRNCTWALDIHLHNQSALGSRWWFACFFGSACLTLTKALIGADCQNRFWLVHQYRFCFEACALTWPFDRGTRCRQSATNSAYAWIRTAIDFTSDVWQFFIKDVFSQSAQNSCEKCKNTLCASITMRREIIATRRAGVTTSVVKEIAPKREQRSRGWKCELRCKFLKN